MARIRILPEILSNKIAAGEVVERPASVVKELVENAIDAGADRIGVEVETGGRRLIRVADNGCGMSRDDALLALERYATSKIRCDADLFAIQTLGFRGEALPSIAAVARFVLATRRREDDAGTEIHVRGGKIENVKDAGIPPGTMITVRDLFFNTPARRKFMKTVATEMAHIGDGLASLALGHPSIHFDLQHNGRPLRRWPSATEPAERVAAVLGADLRRDLLPLDLVTEAVAVSGWTAAPRVNRRSARGIHIFVNGRPVRDRTVRHAILHGYRQRLMKGQFPVVVCHLVAPVGEVDVNVHPAKYEVRFVRQQAVHAAVAGAVRAALTAGERSPGFERIEMPGRPAVPQAPPGVAEPPAAFRRTRPWPVASAASPQGDDDTRSAAPPGVAPYPLGQDSRRSAPPSPQAALWSGGGFAHLNVIGQLGNTYIVCAAEDGLVLIDQHAAHERIYYEQLQQRAGLQNAASQPLLIPETLELDFREATVLGAMQEDLGRLGLAIEPFGGNTFVIRAAPDFLAQTELGPMTREIIERAVEAGVKPDPQVLREASLQTMACHGAIRARQRLDPRQIQRLLVQLDECANPFHCPHGRPTWVRWTMRELEKAFGRRA